MCTKGAQYVAQWGWARFDASRALTAESAVQSRGNAPRARDTPSLRPTRRESLCTARKEDPNPANGVEQFVALWRPCCMLRL